MPRSLARCAKHTRRANATLPKCFHRPRADEFCFWLAVLNVLLSIPKEIHRKYRDIHTDDVACNTWTSCRVSRTRMSARPRKLNEPNHWDPFTDSVCSRRTWLHVQNMLLTHSIENVDIT